jgi:hypothetical protein
MTPPEHPLVLRTDFSNDAAWQDVCAAIRRPVGEFEAYVDFCDDRRYADSNTAELRARLAGYPFSFLIVVDAVALSTPGHPLLVVEMPAGGEFRAVPNTVQSIENNLSITNMDFADFAEAVDEDGVFRGF